MLIIAGGMIPVILSAQSNPLDGMINKYADQPGFYFLEMKTNMFSSTLDDGSSASPGKLISIKILSFEEGSSSSYKAKDIYNQLNSSIDIKAYKGIVEVKNSGDLMDMMVKKDGDKISEVIITLQEETKTTLISATGNFTLKDMAKFSGMKNCRGLETLEKLCEE
jgi:hypothetical protein